jgi:RNA polymerase sigma-70 factor (ECF subfamily)
LIKKTDITKEAFDALVKKGHKHTFEVIYKLYYDKLLHIAISYLGSKEDAEGVVQNVFLKLWGQIYKVEEISNINA